MEKLVFRFRRKPGATREAFFDHYVSVHAPLGLAKKAGLDGYTVNLVEDEVDFDALTEIWTSSAAAFAGGSAQPSDGDQAIIADHLSFMGPQDAYIVDERVVRDGPSPPVAPGVVAPGTKLVQIYRLGETLPAPDEGVTRVVDNVVQTILYDRDQRVDRPPQQSDDVAVIRTLWIDAPRGPNPLSSEGVLVREYRNRAPEICS